MSVETGQPNAWRYMTGKRIHPWKSGQPVLSLNHETCSDDYGSAQLPLLNARYQQSWPAMYQPRQALPACEVMVKAWLWPIAPDPTGNQPVSAINRRSFELCDLAHCSRRLKAIHSWHADVKKATSAWNSTAMPRAIKPLGPFGHMALNARTVVKAFAASTWSSTTRMRSSCLMLWWRFAAQPFVVQRRMCCVILAREAPDLRKCFLAQPCNWLPSQLRHVSETSEGTSDNPRPSHACPPQSFLTEHLEDRVQTFFAQALCHCPRLK
jgi:hypothetical protein